MNNLKINVFRTIIITFIFFIQLLFINNSSLTAQSAASGHEEPAWLIFQKGLKSYENRDYSLAFELFSKASVAKDFPEAEYWIGRIFEVEGEYTLSLKQYERALNIADKSMTEDFNIVIRLSMAGIYEKNKDFRRYQETLEKIISLSDASNTGENIRFANMLSERLKSAGIDKLLYYYRHEGDHLIKPHGDLGIYYFVHGRDQAALAHLTSAITIISSNIIRIFINYDPDYEYSDYYLLLKNSELNDKTADYLVQTDFYRYLFHLGLVLHNFNLPDQSSYIFRMLSESRAGSTYQNMASRIVSNRYSETYIKRIIDTLLYPTE